MPPSTKEKSGGVTDEQKNFLQRFQEKHLDFIPIESGEGGLLVQTRGKLLSIRFVFSILMEFMCTMLFALLGQNPFEPYFIPLANGISLAVLIYVAANVSGGHLNPCVTFATMLTGHMSLMKDFAYVIAQISGSACASLLTVVLRGGAGFSVGMGDSGPGCFFPHPQKTEQMMNGITHWQAAGWEFIFTFILVSTVYAVAIGKPNFGNVGPLVIGLSLYACASVGYSYTGASLNIARTLGPVIVFQCHTNDAWYYVIAELLGGLLAGFISWPLYGTGQDFMRLFDKAATEPEEAEPDEDDEERGKDVESGHRTPNGSDMRELSLRDQYSPGRGPLFNGSLPAVYIGNVLYEPVSKDIPVLRTDVGVPHRVTALEE